MYTFISNYLELMRDPVMRPSSWFCFNEKTDAVAIHLIAGLFSGFQDNPVDMLMISYDETV